LGLAIVSLTLSGGCFSRKAIDVEADVAAVNEIWTQYSSSLNAGDIDRWVALWTDDGIQMPPDEPPVIGKQQIRLRNSAIAEQFTFNIEVNNEEVGVAGDWAFSRGTYSATLAPKTGGKPVYIDWKYMTILQRQLDGTWKIHRDAFNSNVPPDS
jgi:uncharacterized protein (TIGR02246 family)